MAFGGALTAGGLLGTIAMGGCLSENCAGSPGRAFGLTFLGMAMASVVSGVILLVTSAQARRRIFGELRSRQRATRLRYRKARILERRMLRGR